MKIIELKLKLKSRREREREREKKEAKPVRAQRGSDHIGTSQGHADWRFGAGANQSLILGGVTPHLRGLTSFDWLHRRHGTRGCASPWMASCTVSTGVALTKNGLASFYIYTTTCNYLGLRISDNGFLILEGFALHYSVIVLNISLVKKKNITGPHKWPTPVRHLSNRPCPRMHPPTAGSVEAVSPRPSESGSACVCLVSNSSLIGRILFSLVLLPSLIHCEQTNRYRGGP